MATRKISDLSVKVGSYTDKEGNAKGRYENVGAIFQKDDGGTFFAIKRTFNPAGVPNPENRDMVLLSVFDVKDREGEEPKPAVKPAAKPVPANEHEEIPF